MRYLSVAYKIVAPRLKLLAQDNPGIYQEIGGILRNMRGEWFRTDVSRPDLGYSKVKNRLAYAYCHMAAHANSVEAMFNESAFERYFDRIHTENGRFKITVFGAGPGTEVLGVAGWLHHRNQVQHFTVDFSLFDCVEKWYESLKVVVENVYPENGEVCVNGICHPFYGVSSDLLNFQHFEQVAGHDLYIFPYIMSEILNGEVELRSFGRQLRDVIPPHAKLLFIDRHSSEHGHTYKNMCAIINSAGMRKTSLTPLKCVRMPDNQWMVRQSSEFEELQQVIGIDPKRRIDASWLLAGFL